MSVEVELIDKHAKRLGVNAKLARKSMLMFAEMVGLIENDGRTQGSNPASSAKGLYQFTDNSLLSAVNRLYNNVGELPWMARARETRDANLLSRDAQTLLFLANILERPGTDIYLAQAMEGSRSAMLDIYLLFHHTAPDMSVKHRAKRIIYAYNKDV